MLDDKFEKQAEAVIVLAATSMESPDKSVDLTMSAKTAGYKTGPQTWDLKVTKRDRMDKVVQETGTRDGDNVKRTTRHHSNGRIAGQETLVTSALPGKRLIYAEQDAWNSSGELESSSREVNTLDAEGDTQKGERNTKRFECGRLLAELDELWSATTKAWSEIRRHSASFYADGSPKDSATAHPMLDEKVEESWGPKGEHGRDKTTRLWQTETHSWKETKETILEP